PELLELRGYYTKRIEHNKKYDLFRKQRTWFRLHKNTTFFVLIISVILVVASFYASIKLENYWFGIPAAFAFAFLMIFGLISEDMENKICYINLSTINTILQVRSEQGYKKTERKSQKKIIDVHNVVKELKEANITVISKKLREKGTPVSEKTLRKILNRDLKKIVRQKNGPFNSLSRSQKNTTIYYIKENT
ncbi:MAG: hypothetical protein QXM31_00910, partial [Candidatus Woesearchaeota archaeon]